MKSIIHPWRRLPTTRAKIARVTLLAGWLAWMAAMLESGSMYDGFIAYPTEPIAASGQTVPYEVKGIVHYITESESRLMSRLAIAENCGLALFIVDILLDYRMPARWRPAK